MAIMRISRFRDSPETVLAFKHLPDFAEMQPVREPVATLDAMDIEPWPRIVMHLDCRQHDAWQPRRWASVTIRAHFATLTRTSPCPEVCF
jgi:hypothetical protein